jgi:hypothetical protein
MPFARVFLLWLLVLPAPAAHAQDEAAFMQRFVGSFSGSGSVRRNAESGAHDVSCRMTGAASGDRLSLQGSCRAMLIFSRDVGAEVQVAADGSYAGTYIGSVVGPAAISGRRDGDRIMLDVTWPREVNGDTHATMTITNAGDGSFRILVTDRLGAGGAEVVVTDVTLSR